MKKRGEDIENTVESKDNIDKKGMTNRDYKWIIAIMLSIIIILATHWLLVDDDRVMEYFTFMSIGVSITLGIVAIWISISQNTNSNILNGEMKSTLTSIEKTVVGMDTNIRDIKYESLPASKINTVTDAKADLTNEENNEEPINYSNSHANCRKITRYHGYINTSQSLNTNELLAGIRKVLSVRATPLTIIDFSVFGSVRVQHNSRGYLSNFLILVEGETEEAILKDACLTSLNKMGINDIGLDLMLNIV